MSQTVSDIMSQDVISLTLDATMFDAHELMKESNIRHIPITEDNAFYGVVTQKAILSKVMFLLDKYGVNALQRREKSIKISELVDKSVIFASKDMPLSEAAQFFLNHRHGCLPVVDAQNKLLGIVTSSDFVRLSLELLQKE